MKAWLKIAGLGLLGCGLATGCVITSDDDDDEGIGGANVSSGGTTGGTTTTGGTVNGGTAGSTTTTGGTAGDGGAGGVAEPNACEECLQANCADEYQACMTIGEGGAGGVGSGDQINGSGELSPDGTADCINEYAAIQACFKREYDDNGSYWNEVDEKCGSEGALVENFILSDTLKLYNCTVDLDDGPDCTAECFDFADE